MRSWDECFRVYGFTGLSVFTLSFRWAASISASDPQAPGKALLPASCRLRKIGLTQRRTENGLFTGVPFPGCALSPQQPRHVHRMSRQRQEFCDAVLRSGPKDAHQREALKPTPIVFPTTNVVSRFGHPFSTQASCIQGPDIESIRDL